MKGVLKFDLPEENTEFQLAFKGADIYFDLQGFLEDFRKKLKHGYIDNHFNDAGELAEYVIENLSEIINKIEE